MFDVHNTAYRVHCSYRAAHHKEEQLADGWTKSVRKAYHILHACKGQNHYTNVQNIPRLYHYKSIPCDNVYLAVLKLVGSLSKDSILRAFVEIFNRWLETSNADIYCLKL